MWSPARFPPRGGEHLLPVLSALLLVLSFPPLHLGLPPFVALVPLAVFVHQLPPDGAAGRAAFRGGLVLGLLYWGGLLYWIVVALLPVSRLAVLAYLVTVLALASLFGLLTWAVHRMVHAMRVPLWLALPVAWTGMEWTRGHLPDIAFPWLGLGSALTAYPELVGIAEVVGGRGVTFWIVTVNALLALTLLAWRRGRRPLAPALAAGLLVVVPMGWGVWRASSLELRAVGPVAVVQPDIPEDVKLDSRRALDSTRVALDRLMPRIAPGSVELVVWPEVTFPAFFEAWPELERETREHARGAGAPILLGALGYEGRLPSDHRTYNSAFLVTPAGRTGYRYDKRHLVPVVERVPWIDPTRLGSGRDFGAYARGQGWPLARTRDVAGEPGSALEGAGAFGVMICFESAFPQVARAFRKAGADFLVNITNDAWYGREVWYARTTALWQHPAHLVMRAVENRVGIVRAANTGISMFVDPLGRTYERTELFMPDVRTATVFTTDARTLYTRLGDLAGGGSAALLLGAAALALWRDRALPS